MALSSPLLEFSLLSFGDRISPGIYKIHSRFKSVINYCRRKKIVSIVTGEIGGGPRNIVVDDFVPFNSNSLIISKKLIKVGRYNAKINCNLIYNSQFTIHNFKHKLFVKNLALMKKITLLSSHPKSLAFIFDKKREDNFNNTYEREFVKRINDGINKIKSGSLLGGIRLVKGTGFGLTPSGDDFISGLLLALNLYSKLYKINLNGTIERIYEVARTKNLISNCFLEDSKNGFLSIKLKKLIDSLFLTDKRELDTCITSFIDTGETSGADLISGFLFFEKYITTPSE